MNCNCPYHRKEGAEMNEDRCYILANELEVLLARRSAGGTASAGIIDIIAKVQALITAVRSGDWKGIAKAVRDLIDVVIGPDGTVSYSGDGSLDWRKLMELVAQVLLPVAEKAAA